MWRRLALAIVVLLAAFLGYVALKPADYAISRSITVAAPAERIFPLLNNAQKMDTWSPWKEIDPGVVISYSGPAEGVGSVARWESKGEMGVGQATIVESVPNKSVKTKLENFEPVPMTQDAEIRIEEAAGQSTVTWNVSGKNDFMGRLFCVFMDMDAMVGGMFEMGLANLKKQVEEKK